MSIKKVVDIDNTEEILRALSLLDSKEIEIGIFEDGFKNGNELTVFGKAVINEYGASIEVTPQMRAFLHHNGVHLKKDTSHITIPERSFIRGSFDENKQQIDQSVEKMLDAILEGKMTANDLFGTIGENGVRMIRDYIQKSIPPANSSLTLANKKGSNTLIDSGEMLKALDWRVVDK